MKKIEKKKNLKKKIFEIIIWNIENNKNNKIIKKIIRFFKKYKKNVIMRQ